MSLVVFSRSPQFLKVTPNYFSGDPNRPPSLDLTPAWLPLLHHLPHRQLQGLGGGTQLHIYTIHMLIISDQVIFFFLNHDDHLRCRSRSMWVFWIPCRRPFTCSTGSRHLALRWIFGNWKFLEIENFVANYFAIHVANSLVHIKLLLSFLHPFSFLNIISFQSLHRQICAIFKSPTSRAAPHLLHYNWPALASHSPQALF